MTAGGDAPSLAALLAMPETTSASALRFAYERAMAEAVRRGDNARAVALSQAFDALSRQERNSIYASSGDRGLPRATPAAGRRTARSVWRRMLPWCVSVPLTGLGVAAIVLSRMHGG